MPELLRSRRRHAALHVEACLFTPPDLRAPLAHAENGPAEQIFAVCSAKMVVDLVASISDDLDGSGDRRLLSLRSMFARQMLKISKEAIAIDNNDAIIGFEIGGETQQDSGIAVLAARSQRFQRAKRELKVALAVMDDQRIVDGEQEPAAVLCLPHGKDHDEFGRMERHGLRLSFGENQRMKLRSSAVA